MVEQENIMADETVALDEAGQALVIIDQTKLPAERVMLTLTKAEDIWQAIHTLQVRGAPAIGVAAAIGLYVASYRLETVETAAFCTQVRAIKAYLATARPTAVNLFWALARMERVLDEAGEMTVAALKIRLHAAAAAIQAEDTWVCRQSGE